MAAAASGVAGLFAILGSSDLGFVVSSERLLPIAIALAVVATIAAVRVEQRQAAETRSEIGESLGDGTEHLASSLVQASQTIQQIEREIAARQDLVQRLRQDAERHERLVQLKEEDVDAVVQTLGGVVETGSRRSLWQGIALNFVFFILGVVASIGVEARVRIAVHS